MNRRRTARALAMASAGLAMADADASSLQLVQNAAGNHEYGKQVSIPSGFGTGEFTFEIWLKPNGSYPVGPVTPSTPEQLVNWSNVDIQPYSSSGWWFSGNFLLDGHNNNVFQNGTFSLQFYGGGRVRWSFGDGWNAGAGGHWSVQAYSASTTPSLLDGNWHHVACVRRWSGGSSALLELWIDGDLIATQATPVRTNMQTAYWGSWSGFPSNEDGWFFGAEKQAAIGDRINQYEDYKGLVDEMRFWSRAKSVQELENNWAVAVTGNETELVGWYRLNEGGGTSTCNAITSSDCIQLVRTNSSHWVAEDAPVGGPLNPNYVYVDFGAAGPGNGSQSLPFSTLGAAVGAVNAGSTIEIVPSGSSETVVISKPVTIRKSSTGSGSVWVGIPGDEAAAATLKNKDGFIAPSID